MPVYVVRGKWVLSVKHSVIFCLLNQSSHQSKCRDGIENRLRMANRSQKELSRGNHCQRAHFYRVHKDGRWAWVGLTLLSAFIRHVEAMTTSAP